MILVLSSIVSFEISSREGMRKIKGALGGTLQWRARGLKKTQRDSEKKGPGGCRKPTTRDDKGRTGKSRDAEYQGRGEIKGEERMGEIKGGAGQA